MGKRINPATVGAFVLGAIGLILAAVVVFGSGSLFRKTHEFVIYFGGDINGLRVGAPVKFKGVEIGAVKRIKLRLEQDVNRDNGQLRADVRIPVIIELDEEKIVSHGGTAIDLDDPHTVPNLIREGMRAQLGSRQLRHRPDVRCAGYRAEYADSDGRAARLSAPGNSRHTQHPRTGAGGRGPNLRAARQGRFQRRLHPDDRDAGIDQGNHQLARAQAGGKQLRENARATRPHPRRRAADAQHRE